jgi:glucose/arabinose dehydrogenase
LACPNSIIFIILLAVNGIVTALLPVNMLFCDVPMKKIVLSVIFLLLLLPVLAYAFRGKLMKKFFQPTASKLPSSSPISAENPEIVAQDLSIPWEIVFLPDKSLLVTERPGQLLHISGNTHTPIQVSGVQHRGEGGLLGLALHPRYPENHFIYLYLTTQQDGGLTNRVERYVFDEKTNSLSQKKIILENIPGAANHDGGRIAFGPDKLLYITTGDAQQEQQAQDTNSLAGKILRLTDEGTVPADNPFNNPVYSYGHRNPQGLAWDSQGRLWSTEHGPSGAGSGFDEVNLIEKGANYGWPTIQGEQQRPGMRSPVVQSGADDTWAPAGMTIIGDRLYFTGLRGEAIYEATINDAALTNLTTHNKGEFGRLRVIQLGPDNAIYLATSNTDGRGSVNPGDDKIVKLLQNFYQPRF